MFVCKILEIKKAQANAWAYGIEVLLLTTLCSTAMRIPFPDIHPCVIIVVEWEWQYVLLFCHWFLMSTKV